MDPHRVEPTIYEAFMARLAEHSLSPVCGNAWRILAGVDLTHPVFQYPGNIVGRLTPLLIERWELGDDGLFEGLTTWAEVVAKSLDDAMTDLRGRFGRNSRRWRWGRVHRLELIHAFGRRRGLAWFFNAPSVRVGGNTDTVLATSAGAGAALRDAGLRPVLASGHRRGQVGRERRHPPARTVRAAGIPPLPRPLAPLEDQPAVPAVLDGPGGASPRADPACPRAAAFGARDGGRRANIGA